MLVLGVESRTQTHLEAAFALQTVATNNTMVK